MNLKLGYMVDWLNEFLQVNCLRDKEITRRYQEVSVSKKKSCTFYAVIVCNKYSVYIVL